ncbi:MAG: TrkH family potassium uptake protein [Phascolarctobacterium sp.]
MRKSIAHELTQEETTDFERNQLIRYQKRLHYRRLMRSIVNINRSTLIGLSFAFLILMGTFLLCLPISHVNGQWAHPLDAFFTATSASCVTGLAVWDTGKELSLFGQIVLICLIQLGGIGLMTISTLFNFGLHRKMNIRQRLLVQDSLNQDDAGEVLHVAMSVFKYTFLLEFCFGTALALYFYYSLDMGLKGIYWGYWHAISAFCNAGFDLVGNFQSLTGFQGDVVLNMAFILLILIGGLGFTVLDDLLEKRCWKRLTLHSKIVLVVNAILIVLGTVLIWLLEHHNADTIGMVSTGQQWLASLFQSVSLRTAGFNTMDLASLTNATLFFMMGMMFVGASPTSTGGGIKTTTFAVLLASTFALLRDKKDVVLFRRRIDTSIINKSLAVFLLAISWVTMAVFLLLVLDDSSHPFQFVLFEVFSAMGTVGMGIGITPEWNPWCKLVLIMTMFIGRIGILTFGMSFFNKRVDKLRYPTENVMIG